jgi:hypothetical protein
MTANYNVSRVYKRIPIFSSGTIGTRFKIHDKENMYRNDDPLQHRLMKIRFPA